MATRTTMCRISTPRRLPKPSPVPHWLPSPVATTPRRWSTAQPSRHRSVPRTARGGPPPALTATSGQFAAGYWTWYGQYGQALHNPNIDATPHTCRRGTVSVDSIGRTPMEIAASLVGWMLGSVPLALLL